MTNYIIGIDEVGTGALSGPIFVGAVRAPKDWTMQGLRDSKKLSREQRAKFSNEINNCEEIIKFLVEASNDDIDRFGLGVAHKQSFVKAIEHLFQNGDEVILDGNLNPISLLKFGLDPNKLNNVKSVVKADDKFPPVMAASIIAKHHRDTLMTELSKTYSQYGWEENSGYSVPKHLEAIRKYGLCPLHRKSYKVKL